MAADDTDDTMARLPPAYLEVAGVRLYFPVESLKTTYQKRIGKHRRLFRNGMRGEILGDLEEVFEVSGLLHKGQEDPAIEQQGIAPYPDLANRIREAFRIGETADFMHPREGIKRVIVEELVIIEESSKRNAAAYTAKFTEDNEDDASQKELRPDNGVVGLFAELNEAVQETGKAGVTQDVRQTLAEIADVLAGPSPEEAANTYLVQYATDTFAACYAIGVAMTEQRPLGYATGDAIAKEVGQETGSVVHTRDVRSPRHHWAHRSVAKLQDRAAAARAPQVQIQKPTKPKLVLRQTSLFAIAAATGASLEELIAANPHVDAIDVLPDEVINVPIPKRAA
jgi:LysM repeat protein